MSTSVTLDEQSVVCRTCLKVLDKAGYTYLDDESVYVKNVGNIREMLQFCVPELDLYVSTLPVICNQCLPILVQVYNFKIKCLNGENTIKAYISRNNLHEYNHVNLNCVLMDDLRMKSQKIQIESRIKHMMLKELPESGEIASEQHQDESMEITPNVNQANNETIEKSFTIVLTESGIDVNPQEIQDETIDKEMKIEIEEPDGADRDYNGESQGNEAEPPDSAEEESDINAGGSLDEDSNTDKHMNMVVVRKDLFQNNNQSKQKSVEAPPTKQHLILNKEVLPKNGRIVIKIDRKKLQNFTVATSESEATHITNLPDQNKSEVIPPPLTPLQGSTTSSNNSEDSCIPQIVTVETVEGSSVKQSVYNCNKCNFVTHDVIKMYDHNRTYHSFDYTCQHCPFSTSKVELLGKHMTMVHPQNMVFQRNLHFKVTENYACSMCPFSVKNIDLLRSHHLSAHGQSDPDTGPIVLNTAFTEDVAKNELRILKRLEYTCDVCPYTTKDKSNLRKHLFTHGTKPLKCDHCTYKCVSPYQLRRHQKQKHARHMDPRPRNQPYELPDFKGQKKEALDNFKITLESIKRELEKEIST